MSDPRDRFRERFITVLGSGHLRPANATWGSLAVTLLFAVPCLAVFWAERAWATPLRWLLDVAVLTPAILGAALLSVWWGEWAIAYFRSKDPRPFVLDELAGQGIAFLALPPAAWESPAALAAVLAGQFLLFRVFDVLKLPPARQLESLPAGWGILCDDLVAGLVANLAGQVLWRYTPLAAALGLAGGAAG